MQLFGMYDQCSLFHLVCFFHWGGVDSDNWEFQKGESQVKMPMSGKKINCLYSANRVQSDEERRFCARHSIAKSHKITRSFQCNYLMIYTKYGICCYGLEIHRAISASLPSVTQGDHLRGFSILHLFSFLFGSATISTSIAKVCELDKLLTPFYRCRIQSLERLENESQTSKLVSMRTGI